MKEELILFEAAKLAKEKGFNIPVSRYYKSDETLVVNFEDSRGAEREYNFEADDFDENWNDKRVVNKNNESCWGCSNGYFQVYSAPTQSLLQKWLREVHNLHIYIDTTPSFDKMQGSKYKSTIKVPFSPFKWTTGHYYLGNTYEEALEEALLQGLKLIK